MKTMFVSLLGGMLSVGAVADTPLLLNSQSLTGGCNVTNLGEYSGTVSMVPQFTLASYTCSAGYYLPADGIACVACPQNNYCVGGTYTYNETTDQGITQCGSGLVAPSGMWEVAQCGHKLHLGDEVLYLRSVKKTTPSLNIKTSTGETFHANATTTETPIHAGSTHKLKLTDGVTVWYVYDDTITVP